MKYKCCSVLQTDKILIINIKTIETLTMMILQKTVSAIALAMTLAMPFCASAQSGVEEMETKGKPNVLVDYFWFTKNMRYASLAATQLRGYAIESLMNTKRAEIMDVETLPALQIEAERREEGVNAGDDAERIKVMAQEGANAILTASVTNVIVEKKKLDDGSIYYEAQVAYTIKTINPNNGKAILSRNFTHGGTMLGDDTGSTPEEALANTCKQARGGLTGFFQEAFPLFGLLLETGEVKGDKLNSAYISLGDNHGVAKKDKFDVCVVREIAGNKSTKVIGEAEVDAVEGDNISLVKIKKNQKEVKAAIDAGQTIVFKSKPKGENLKDKLGKWGF